MAALRSNSVIGACRVCRVGGFLGDDEISRLVRIGFARGIVPTRRDADARIVCVTGMVGVR
jgi:hypothetical protein